MSRKERESKGRKKVGSEISDVKPRGFVATRIDDAEWVWLLAISLVLKGGKGGQ